MPPALIMECGGHHRQVLCHEDPWKKQWL